MSWVNWAGAVVEFAAKFAATTKNEINSIHVQFLCFRRSIRTTIELIEEAGFFDLIQ
jgi:hypothetical protein